ncbi:hypothetical protein BaRGS_00003061, partial [Batillaria attramentaria]
SMSTDLCNVFFSQLETGQISRWNIELSFGTTKSKHMCTAVSHQRLAGESQ